MKSLATKEYLTNENFLRGEGYTIGILGKEREAKALGYSVQKNQLIGQFDGVHTFLSLINSDTKFGNREALPNDDSKQSGGGRWTTHKTYEASMKAMLKNPQSFRDFKEADLRLKDYEQPTGLDVEYGVTGDFMDIGRVVEGQPEAFGTMRSGNVVNKFASIVLAGMSSASTDIKDIQKRSNLTLRLVDMLEANNVRCKVTVLYSNNNWHCEVGAKQYRDVLDIDDLAVATSGDFFRRAQFRFAEHSATLTWSYGMANKLKVSTVKDDDADLTIAISNTYSGDWGKQFEQLERHLSNNDIQYGDTAELLNGALMYNETQVKD